MFEKVVDGTEEDENSVIDWRNVGDCGTRASSASPIPGPRGPGCLCLCSPSRGLSRDSSVSLASLSPDSFGRLVKAQHSVLRARKLVSLMFGHFLSSPRLIFLLLF